MDIKTKQLNEERAKIIKAVAHPTRIFIIEELEKQKRSVGELTAMVGADFSTVSKHLSVLKNAGILSDERKGNTIIYTLKTPCILSFIGCVEEVIKTNADENAAISRVCVNKTKINSSRRIKKNNRMPETSKRK